MPFYDLICAQGHETRDVLAKVGEKPPCETCGAPTDTLWTARAVVPAVTWPGGKTFDNLGPEPITFYDRSAYQRHLKAHHLEEFVRHQPVPGSDKSPHTTRWVSMSQDTLDGARAMLERMAQPKKDADYVAALTLTEADEVGTVLAARGTFGVFETTHAD